MVKSFVGHFVLLIGGLGLAYWASLPKSEGSSDYTEWFKIDPKKIVELTYQSSTTKVRAMKRSGRDDFWIEYQEKKENSEEFTELEGFKASMQFKDLLETFNPFYAIREIGVVAQDKLVDYGLGSDAAQFGISDGTNQLSLKIGKKSYASTNVFVLDENQNKVILTKGTEIENFSKAKLRLYERNIYNFLMDDVQKAVIKATGKEKSLDHTKRDNEGMLGWRSDDEKAELKASYKTWMEKIARLRVLNFATEQELENLKNAAILLELTFSKDSKVLDTIVVKTIPNQENNKDYWLYSEFLGSHVKVSAHTMDPIEKDIPTIMNE